MARIEYTVKKGDTLSELAVQYRTTVSTLVKVNDIEDPDIIVVGQKLNIIYDEEVKPVDILKPKNTSPRAKIKAFGLQSNTTNTIYAAWTWTKANTENYRVIWYYSTGDGIWFIGNDSTVDVKQSTYNAPSNALRVKFKVKPISKKDKVNGKEVSHWTASWSTEKIYNFKDNPPLTPSAPTVTIDKFKLTAELDNLSVNATSIQFQIIKNDKSVYKSGTATIKTNHASYSCKVAAGNEYKVRCRSVRKKEYSDWSEYSSNVSTVPSTPKQIETLKALSETSVYIRWTKVTNSTSYDIEYTTQKRYFDSSTEVKTTSVDSTVRHAEITGLETGNEYFFRVRAVNKQGNSSWSPIKSIKIGKKPAAPTTWSSTTTVITGDPLILYWVHNAEDGSSQTIAELETIINGAKETYFIENTTDEETKDKTSSKEIYTSPYTEGTQIQWRVRTAGITRVYGDWSIQRTVDVYAPPTLELSVTDSSGELIETLTSFPFYISGTAEPNTQNPIGYHVSVSSDEAYTTVDSIGNEKNVKEGEEVYSKYFDTSDKLLRKLSAGDIDLENNISYTVTCTVSMDSGLTAESSSSFNVAWTDEEYQPNAEIGIEEDDLSASIRPFCEDEDGNLIEGITLSVYRREYDGTFTEIATGIDNTKNTYVTDPHPALDYARYRIVAITDATGAVSYYDPPGTPVGESSVIIQWDDQWSSFDTTNEDEMEEPTWSGSLLKLPYNIDVSENRSLDVSLVKYIGRRNPVSYYGTQVGETANWKVDVPKSDKETLYALRRLSIYMGDVYVREPSGSGYWASISVSFSQTHRELKIPVTLNITRVEGGM